LLRVTLDSNVYVSALNFGGVPARLLELAAVNAFRDPQDNFIL